MAGEGTHPTRKPNRLAQEESPYLLQHAENPVDWYPWSQEAFALARERDCPIFLSIGYSTCHWCHVMERESFESDAIAELLNKNYVSIKVDREERPDVDKVYMSYVQATTGGGGWPMSVFLAPDLTPFFGGTYFPPTDLYGRPGFPTVLNRIAEVWAKDKESIKQKSDEAMKELVRISTSDVSGGPLEARERDQAIEDCAHMITQRFDSRHGGFGSAPKFPRPSEIHLLLTHHARQLASGAVEDAKKTLHMATFTLNAMAAGGMRDQLGGGFHRYSVDELFHVPHFEIMLYDQPQLIAIYISAFQITHDTRHARVARGVMDYLMRDLRHAGGAFFAAEDADSLDPSDNKKKEGEFYVWKEDEVDKLLGSELSGIFKEHYGIKKAGNATRSARSDPQGEFKNKNVLYEARSVATTAKILGTSEGQAEETLATCREELFNARKTRPRPHRDEKIVAAWNGATLGALAVASRALASEDAPVERLFPVEGRDPKEYLTAATEAAAFTKANLYDDETKRLHRAFTRGPSATYGFSDDYALLISGLLFLYSAGGNVAHLQWALDLQTTLDAEFWDGAAGGYFQGPAGDASIKMRMKEDYDGAEVASSSIAAANLWRLGGMLSGQPGAALVTRAEQCVSAFSGRLKEASLAMAQMCSSLHLLSVGHPRQVIIAGKRGSSDTEALINASFSAYAPDMAVIHIDAENSEEVAFWKKHNSEAVAMVEGARAAGRVDKATAFVCQNFTCKAPTQDPAMVVKELSEPRVMAGSKPKVSPVNFKL